MYATKLGELGGEDWISFRGRLYVFEDFVIEWLEKARAAPAGAVADFLKSELAKFRDVAPLLKYVRGEPFQQEHWAALFRKLSIEKVDLAKLTLGHFLAAAGAHRRRRGGEDAQRARDRRDCYPRGNRRGVELGGRDLVLADEARRRQRPWSR